MKFSPIGVAGLGHMGRGITACLLSQGYSVIAFDPSQEAREGALAYISEALQQLVARASFPESILEDWRGRLTEASSLDAFSPCRFVIESVLRGFGNQVACFR